MGRGIRNEKAKWMVEEAQEGLKMLTFWYEEVYFVEVSSCMIGLVDSFGILTQGGGCNHRRQSHTHRGSTIAGNKQHWEKGVSIKPTLWLQLPLEQHYFNLHSKSDLQWPT